MRNGQDFQDAQLGVFKYIEKGLRDDFGLSEYGAMAWAKVGAAEWARYVRADKNEHAADIATPESVARYALYAGSGLVAEAKYFQVGGSGATFTRKPKTGGAQ